MDYAGLTQLVESYLARPTLAPWYQSFISAAETWLNYGSQETPALRVREMEEIDTLTPTDGVAVLPGDYLEYITVAEADGRQRVLDYITPDQAHRWYPSQPGGGAQYFTIIGENLHTFPQASGDLSLTYYKTIPPLTPVDDTNWLLAKNPNIYLHATLFAAFTFDRNAAEASAHAGLASSLINGMNRSGMMAKYRRAGLTPRGTTP